MRVHTSAHNQSRSIVLPCRTRSTVLQGNSNILFESRLYGKAFDFNPEISTNRNIERKSNETVAFNRARNPGFLFGWRWRAMAASRASKRPSVEENEKRYSIPLFAFSETLAWKRASFFSCLPPLPGLCLCICLCLCLCLLSFCLPSSFSFLALLYPRTSRSVFSSLGPSTCTRNAKNSRNGLRNFICM